MLRHFPGGTARERGGVRTPTTLRLRDVASGLGIPRSTLALSFAGLFIALALLAWRAWLARSRTAVHDAREGWVDGDVIVFHDGALPARGALLVSGADGPAIAWPSDGDAPATYRDDGTRGAWHPESGARQAHLEELGRATLGLTLDALATFAVTSLPLLIAIGVVPWP